MRDPEPRYSASVPIPRFEVPVGTVDGVNRVFRVSQSYLPLTVAVFLNGQLKERSLVDGWVETDPSGGYLELKEAPRSFGNLDVVQVFYLDTSPVVPESEVSRLVGSVALTDDMAGEISESIGLVARMSGEVEDLSGVVWIPVAVRGELAERELVRGTIVEVC